MLEALGQWFRQSTIAVILANTRSDNFDRSDSRDCTGRVDRTDNAGRIAYIVRRDRPF